MSERVRLVDITNENFYEMTANDLVEIMAKKIDALSVERDNLLTEMVASLRETAAVPDESGALPDELEVTVAMMCVLWSRNEKASLPIAAFKIQTIMNQVAEISALLDKLSTAVLMYRKMIHMYGTNNNKVMIKLTPDQVVEYGG